MAAMNPRLADLSDDDRLVLESWLIEFDQRWEDGIFAGRVQQIPPGSSWRLPALAEMVKIDLERQWQRGRRVSLESYLNQFPELGNPDDVSADLIQAEYEVRRQFGAPADLEDYPRRFPHQAGELARLIAQGDSSLSRGSPPGGGDPNPSQIAQELPEQFGRYRILGRLGQGGMGAVYLAEDTQLQRRVALKVANLDAHDGPRARKRLLAEARAAATLDHPYLCPVHDAGEIGGRVYLTMAYIEGQSLAESTRDKSLPARQVTALVGKLALAMQEAHAKGVIHRDLKPSNVMIKSKGQRREPVIVDFGLARRDDPDAARLTKTCQVMGTLDYMSPEQIRGELKEIGPACDIYALGVILYELLTGHLPFAGSGLAVVCQILTQTPLPPSSHRPDLDPRLEAICLKAMAKAPADRHASMADLAAALTEYLRARSTSATPTPSTSAPAASGPAPPPAKSHTLVARLLDRVVEPESSLETEEEGARWQVPARVWPPVMTLVLLLGFFGAWMGGVFKAKTPDGVIVLENVPKDSEILVDGSKITFTWPGLGKPVEVRAVPGQHKVEVKKDGFKTYGEVVSFKTDESEEVTVRLEPIVVVRPGPNGDKVPEPKPEVVVPWPVNAAPSEPKEITNTLGMKLVLIPAGEFLMGSPDSDKDAWDDEKPPHRVRITRPFYLGVTEVTQGQYRAVTGESPSHFQGSDDLPVEQISWNDAISFSNKLNEREGLKTGSQSGGDGYRLPTEAEWEHACRARNPGRHSFGNDAASLGEHAWFNGNSGDKTHPVGQKRPNALGLYDMYGNVWEWCWDGHDAEYYAHSLVDDPRGSSGASLRVVRGGSWSDGPRDARSASRHRFTPDYRDSYLGFRLARVQSGSRSESGERSLK